MPKQVRGLSVYRSTIERLPQFRILSGPLTEHQAAMLGFDDLPLAGASIVPSAEGPATLFNARGKEIIRKDLPMVTKSRSINTSWKDWHGRTHHVPRQDPMRPIPGNTLHHLVNSSLL